MENHKVSVDWRLLEMACRLRRVSISRPSGSWSEHDFDVFEGDRAP
jgi:hypothetical protein